MGEQRGHLVWLEEEALLARNERLNLPDQPCLRLLLLLLRQRLLCLHPQVVHQLVVGLLLPALRAQRSEPRLATRVQVLPTVERLRP